MARVKVQKKHRKTKQVLKINNIAMKKWSDCFKKTDVKELNGNVFKLIGDEWFLITAGGPGNFNTMTASWGTMGVFWHKPVAICFVRPTRHTYNYIEEEEYFTLSFLKDGNRDILNYCGSKSGRDYDKIAETGLKPVKLENGTVAYEQAKMVIECRKMYFDDLKPVFFLPDNADDKFYPDKDYHRMYFGEIINAYQEI